MSFQKHENEDSEHSEDCFSESSGEDQCEDRIDVTKVIDVEEDPHFVEQLLKLLKLNSEQMFLLICEQGDVGHFENLFEEEPRFNLTRKLLTKGLNIACKTANDITCKYLIELGAKPDKDTFAYACQGGYINFVKKFMKPDSNLEEGFCYACEEGRMDIVKFLIEKGAKAYDDAFHCACQGKDTIEVVKFLEPYVTSFNDGFYMACLTGNKDVVKFILDVCKKMKRSHSKDIKQKYILLNLDVGMKGTEKGRQYEIKKMIQDAEKGDEGAESVESFFKRCLSL